MRVLVTGGTGMVGRNILADPQAQEHEVFAPTRVELDLFDFIKTREYLKKNRPDFIVHCAGRVGGIKANMSYPVEFLVENVDMNRSLIMAAAELKIQNFLNLSSSCVYPKDSDQPLREEQILTGPLEPTNEGYAIAKIFAMKLCEYISETRGLFYRSIIPCNMYGKFDHFDPLRSHLIPAIILKVQKARISGENSVEIWGDGQSRREFMYAGDMADFVWSAIRKFHELPQNINVGLGYDYSILEYYQAVVRASGLGLEFYFDKTKPSGMKRKLTDISKLEKFGWKAKTSLEKGIGQTMEYFLQLKDRD